MYAVAMKDNDTCYVMRKHANTKATPKQSVCAGSHATATVSTSGLMWTLKSSSYPNATHDAMATHVFAPDAPNVHA